MHTPRSQDMSASLWARRITKWMSRLMRVVSVHWLALANVAMALYGGLPILAPILMHVGHERAANLIYLLFRPLCHQLPERSFFLYGLQPIYSVEELKRLLATELVPSRYIGNSLLGFKTAVCQRDVATYGSMFFFGLIFNCFRECVKPLKMKQFVLFLVPMAIDGFGQLFGLWESAWWSRVITGSLFGLAAVWLTFPYLEQGMSEVQQSTRQ